MEYGNFYCPIRWNPFTVFQYLGFVSKTVYEESVSHLTEDFSSV